MPERCYEIATLPTILTDLYKVSRLFAEYAHLHVNRLSRRCRLLLLLLVLVGVAKKSEEVPNLIGSNLEGTWRITSQLSNLGENSLLWHGKNGHGAVAAIKIPRDIENAARNEKRQKRFKNEINTLLLVQRMGMKSVIPIIDHGITADGKPWYAMPIGTQIELPPSFLDRLKLISQLTDVIEKLHIIGIEHLDIKPDNLLMIDGELVLSDFGHSKATEPNQLVTRREASNNSVAQLEQKALDPDRPWFDYDMYSLGKACWEMMTGLKSKSLCELQSPDDDLAPHWPAINPTIIKKLQVTLFTATVKDPLDRPKAVEFNHDIRDILNLVTAGKT